MLYTIESSKNVDETGKSLEAAIEKRKFGVLTVHDIKETMAKKGVEFDKECRIYEVCNPSQAKKNTRCEYGNISCVTMPNFDI